LGRSWQEGFLNARSGLKLVIAAHDCFAGCEAQYQQTAFAKQKRQDVVFCVNTAKLRLPSKNDRMSCFA